MKAIFFIFPISLGIAICTAIILYNYQFTNMIQGRHLLIASQIANIRSGPDTGYEIIKRLKTGELLVADGIAYSPDNNPWIRIKLYGEVEKIGYISAKLLTYANGNPILPYGCITKDKVKLITAQNAIYLHKDQIVKIVSLSLNNQKHLLFKIVTSTNKTGYIGSGALKFYPYYLTGIQFYTSLTLSIAATLIICIFIFLYQKRSLIDGNNSGHNIDNQSIILHSSNWGSHIFLCVGGLIFIFLIFVNIDIIFYKGIHFSKIPYYSDLFELSEEFLIDNNHGLQEYGFERNSHGEMTIFKDDTIDGSEGNSRAGEKEYGIVLEDTNTEYRNKMEDYIWVMFKVMLVCFFVNSFYRSCCSIFVEIFGDDLSYKIRDQYLHKKFSTKFIINLISIFIILAISIFSLKKFFYLQDFVFLPMAQYETLVLITQAYASGIVLSFFKYAIDAIFIVKGKNPLKTYADDIISSLIGITVVKLIYNPSSEVIFISIGIAYLKHVMFKLIVRNAHKEF